MGTAYTSILTAELLHRRKRNASYSLRAFASSLGLDSSALSRVLNGKQDLSVRAAVHVMRKLKLSPEDQERFIVSVARARYMRMMTELSLGSEVHSLKAALRVSEERFRVLFETIDQGFELCELVRDAGGAVKDVRLLRVNPAWERHTGIDPKDVLNRNASEWMPNYEQHWLDLYERVVRTRVPERREYHSIDLDRWFEVYVLPSEDDRFMSIVSSITERKRCEEALRLSERRLTAITNLVPDLLWISDSDGRTFWYNQRWIEYTGQTQAQASDWGWVNAIHPDDRERSERAYAAAIEAETQFAQEHRIRAADGTYRWFLARSAPVFDESTKTWQMYGAATDIHHLRVRDQ